MNYRNVYKNLVLLVFGSIGSKLVTLLSMPLVTRLYSPEDFGLLSIFMSIATVLATIVTLRYVVAFPLPKRDASATNLLVATLLITFCFCLLVVFVLLLLPISFFNFAGIGVIYDYRAALVFCVMAVAVYEIFSMWCVRNKNFKAIVVSGFYQSLSGAGVKLAFGLLSGGAFGLVLGNIAQSSSGLFLISKKAVGDIKKYKRCISIKRMMLLLRRYVDMPIYRLPGQFFYVLAAQAMMPLTAKYYSIDVTGKLGLALMALALPVSLISQQAGKVYYSEIARMESSSDIYNFSKHFTLRVMALAVLPAALLFFTGEWMFSLVFGDEWAESGKYASILSMYLLFQFAASPIISYLNVVNRQWVGLIIHVTRATLVFLIFIVCGTIGVEFLDTLWLYSAFLSAHYLAVILLIIWMMKARVKNA